MKYLAPCMKRIVLAVALFAALLLMASCAPHSVASDNLTEDEEGAEVPVVELDWSPESDCAVCHAMESSSFQDSACLASMHQDAICVECHADTTGLESQHKDVVSGDEVPKHLSETAVLQETCLSSECHDSPHADLEKLAERTEGSQALIDSEGTVVNPHDLPDAGTHDTIVCTDCHSVHENGTDVAERAKTTCLNCHHDDVFECYTCHS